MRNIGKSIVFLLLVLLSSSTYLALTYNLGLSPLKAELVMYPGETQEYELRLINGTLANIYYQLEIGAFKLDEDGKYIYLDKKDDYAFSAASWVNFEVESTQVLVRALGQKKVKIKVTVPRNLKHGGDYYAMIWANFIPSNQNKTQKASGTSISMERRFRFGSILHISVKGRPSRSKLEIEKINVIDFDEIATSTKRGLELDVFVKNLGDLSYRPTGEFLITSPDRKVWGRGKLEMAQTDLVMPNLERKMYAIYDRSLPTGEYIAKVSVKSGKRYIGQKEYKFFVKESTTTAKLLGVNFKVQPQEIILDAKAGYTQMNKLEVSNREFTTIDVKLSPIPLYMSEDGQFFYGTSTLKDVRIYPQKFSLREDQKRIVPFSLKVPRQAKGQVVFAIKVSARLKNSLENKSDLYVPVLMRLDGSTTYAFKINKVKKIFDFPATTTQNATLLVRIWFENNGNTFTNFNLTYDLVDPDGNYLTSQAKRLSRQGFLIFPNSERYVDIPLGDYKFKKAGTYSIPLLLEYKADKNKTAKVKMKVNFEITEKEIQKMVEGTI